MDPWHPYNPPSPPEFSLNADRIRSKPWTPPVWSKNKKANNKTYKWNYLKLQNFYRKNLKLKNNKNKNKNKSYWMKENYLHTIYQIKNWYPRFIKHSQTQQQKNPMIAFPSGTKRWTDIFPKKTYRWPIGTWKCAHHSKLGKCKSK